MSIGHFVGAWVWLWPLTDILRKGLLSDGDSRMLFLFIFSVDYWFLLLIVNIFFVYILFKKDTKIDHWKKRNILRKMNLLKKGEGVPLLNFDGGPRSQHPGPTFTPCQTPFTFWDMRTWDMWKVCYKHRETIEYVKN